MSLCTSATESDVRRGKNLLRNALVSHLDGESRGPVGRGSAHPGSDSPRGAPLLTKTGRESFPGCSPPQHPAHGLGASGAGVGGPGPQPVGCSDTDGL